MAFLLIFSLWKCGQNFTCQLVGFIYPAVASIIALRTEETDDDTQWLTYWVGYAGFILAESLTDAFASMLPLYYVFKTLFLVWMFHPNTLGAKMMFENVINPVCERLESAWGKYFDQEKQHGLKKAIAHVAANLSIKHATAPKSSDEAKTQHA